jgi:hypothetical protein
LEGWGNSRYTTAAKYRLYTLKNTEFCQEPKLPQKKSNRKGTMPQNKNLTQIRLSEGGFGKTNGVINAGKKGAYK